MSYDQSLVMGLVALVVIIAVVYIYWLYSTIPVPIVSDLVVPIVSDLVVPVGSISDVIKAKVMAVWAPVRSTIVPGGQGQSQNGDGVVHTCPHGTWITEAHGTRGSTSGNDGDFVSALGFTCSDGTVLPSITAQNNKAANTFATAQHATGVKGFDLSQGAWIDGIQGVWADDVVDPGMGAYGPDNHVPAHCPDGTVAVGYQGGLFSWSGWNAVSELSLQCNTAPA